MLIRFTVSNYLSFNEEAEFSMIPGKSRNHPEHLVKGSKRSSIDVLRTAVIMGANASGKSNLIKAIAFARNLIINGTRPKKHIRRDYFKLDQQCATKPSRFEFEFKINDKAFAYGFEVDARKIHHEWLYEINKSSQKMLFERTSSDTNEAVVELGAIHFTNKDDKQLLKLLKTRDNQLFLTQSLEAGAEQFTPVINWFLRMIIILPDYYAQSEDVSVENDEKMRETLVKLLKVFDTGIADLHLVSADLKNEFGIVPDEIDIELTEKLEKGEKALIKAPNGTRYLLFMGDDKKIKVQKLMISHKIKNSDEVALLNMDDESDGTRRLMDILPLLHVTLNENRVCLIDELDRSLHPKLCTGIFEYFLKHTGSKEGQMIATTHESSLLNLNLLRRDEFWFVEKNDYGASAVFSLEEFIPRYDSDIRKGYLLGRFGGVPVVGNVS